MTTRKKNWLVSSVLRTARWIYPIANVDRDNTVVTIKLKTSAAPMFVVTNAIVSVHGDVAFERGDVDGVASVIALSASSAICVRHPVVCVALAMDPIVVMRDEFVACSGSIVGVTKESVTVSGDGSTCWLIGGHNNNGPLLTGDVLLYTIDELEDATATHINEPEDANDAAINEPKDATSTINEPEDANDAAINEPTDATDEPEESIMREATIINEPKEDATATTNTINETKDAASTINEPPLIDEFDKTREREEVSAGTMQTTSSSRLVEVTVDAKDVSTYHEESHMMINTTKKATEAATSAAMMINDKDVVMRKIQEGIDDAIRSAQSQQQTAVDDACGKRSAARRNHKRHSVTKK